MNALRFSTVVLTLFFLTSCASKEGETVAGSAPAKAGTSKPYNYDKCLVIEQPLNFGGGPFTRNYKGREVKFCCRPCIKTFEADPDIWIAKLDRWDAGAASASSSGAQSSGE